MPASGSCSTCGGRGAAASPSPCSASFSGRVLIAPVSLCSRKQRANGMVPVRHAVLSSPSHAAAAAPAAAAARSSVRTSAFQPSRLGETADEALERRLRESYEVESRVVEIYSQSDLDREMEAAGSKLVVLEVQSDEVCETGYDEPEPDVHWRIDAERMAAERMAKCAQVKHVFQRTARSCPDVTFLNLTTDGEAETEALIQSLGVTTFPTLHFYKSGRLLWQHRGVMQMEDNLGQGMMFYGDATLEGGFAPSSVITDINSRQDYKAFLASQPDPKTLTVLTVSLTAASPCLKVFPAVVALARSFQGFAAFGHMIGDSSPETSELLKELRVSEVPTFIFYRAGEEVGRHVGSSRGDLIGKILEQQAAAGVQPPPPPASASQPRVRRSVVRRR